MPWTWRYEDRDGTPVAPEGVPTEEFPSQADAETWLGEGWQGLRESGVGQVTLLEDGREVYGPMSLDPAD
jgi:hypothetical protein